MKKLLALAVAIILALGCMSAFAVSGPIEGVDYPELPDGTLKITVTAPLFTPDAQTTRMQKLWQEKMEAYLGVKLDITWQTTAWDDWQGKEQTQLAAGEYGDVNSYSQGDYVNSYGAAGKVLNISEYKDYMAYYPEFVAGVLGGWDGIQNADGSSYVFWDGYDNDLNLAGGQSFSAYAYRFDVLKKYDLKPATTWEEFKELCAALQGLIDDGTVTAADPEAKVYVMTNCAKGYAFYRGFVGIFHTWDTLYWNGTEFSYGPIEDNFRTMLSELHELYAAGYIDPEFQTRDDATAVATTGQVLCIPTLWLGYLNYSYNPNAEEGIEWGLAYLPENEEYGRPWKWGSKITGKNLGTNRTMGIYIDAETEYPEWVVSMIDYQYSPDIYLMLNWGEEGEDWYLDPADGLRHYTDKIMGLPSSERAQALADEGIMSSATCRTGIPFVPQIFSTISAYSDPDPWWSPERGYYEGYYWMETAINGGPESISPYDRAPLVNLTEEQKTQRSTLTSACDKYAKTEGNKFITGENDINDDAVWAAYVEGVKSQFQGFDQLIETINESVDLDSLSLYKD